MVVEVFELAEEDWPRPVSLLFRAMLDIDVLTAMITVLTIATTGVELTTGGNTAAQPDSAELAAHCATVGGGVGGGVGGVGGAN